MLRTRPGRLPPGRAAAALAADSRLDALRDDTGNAPQWSFTRSELDVLAKFYRRCADRGFAVYADDAHCRPSSRERESAVDQP